MPEIICDTSPIQYLYQAGLLDILPKLAQKIWVPPAVIEEISIGRKHNILLPDPNSLEWITIKRPVSELALPLIKDMGAGETQVLMLALEMRDAVVILDDLLARRLAENLDLRLTGTLGLILDAKKRGIIESVTSVLDRLESLRFRLAADTKAVVLKLAGE